VKSEEPGESIKKGFKVSRGQGVKGKKEEEIPSVGIEQSVVFRKYGDEGFLFNCR